MNFDKTAYQASRERVIRLIKASHDWENTEGFIADGVINPDIYASQPLRVLCVLAESYGYDECGMVDIEEQPQSDLMGVGNPAVKTPRRMAAMLGLLFLSMQRDGTKPSFDEWRTLSLLGTAAESIATHQSTLSKIAWINVKKASNPRGTELDPEDAHAHALRNKAILQEQIASVAPHLMLVCGRDAFASLLNLGLLAPQTAAAGLWQLHSMPDGTRLIKISHPAYFPDWGSYEAIYRNFERLHEQRWR